jgi:hypothetical protein
LKILVASVVSALLAILGTVVFQNLSSFSQGFWDVKFANLIQPFATLIVGGVFAYFVPDIVGKVKTRRQLQSEELFQLLKSIDQVSELGSSYFSAPKKALENEILFSLTQLSRKIDFVEELNKLESIANFDRGAVRLLYFEVKSLLTDSPFGSTKKEFSADRIAQFRTKCSDMRKMVSAVRYKLFV